MEALFDGLMWNHFLGPYLNFQMLWNLFLVCILAGYMHRNLFMRKETFIKEKPSEDRAVSEPPTTDT